MSVIQKLTSLTHHSYQMVVWRCWLEMKESEMKNTLGFIRFSQEILRAIHLLSLFSCDIVYLFGGNRNTMTTTNKIKINTKWAPKTSKKKENLISCFNHSFSGISFIYVHSTHSPHPKQKKIFFCLWKCWEKTTWKGRRRCNEFPSSFLSQFFFSGHLRTMNVNISCFPIWRLSVDRCRVFNVLPRKTLAKLLWIIEEVNMCVALHVLGLWKKKFKKGKRKFIIFLVRFLSFVMTMTSCDCRTFSKHIVRMDVKKTVAIWQEMEWTEMRVDHAKFMSS